jgi:hypothetical protein
MVVMVVVMMVVMVVVMVVAMLNISSLVSAMLLLIALVLTATGITLIIFHVTDFLLCFGFCAGILPDITGFMPFMAVMISKSWQ